MCGVAKFAGGWSGRHRVWSAARWLPGSREFLGVPGLLQPKKHGKHRPNSIHGLDLRLSHPFLTPINPCVWANPVLVVLPRPKFQPSRPPSEIPHAIGRLRLPIFQLHYSVVYQQLSRINKAIARFGSERPEHSLPVPSDQPQFDGNGMKGTVNWLGTGNI